ncbi:hypothetical protein M514_07573 [Trichuris suis]|uniref:Uncharacterized protein n=1 Tax=Trichuris suis TaxID=68888 RepID=A0A085NCL1_9BILA|nr:hypothetical protein M513_07573 [Trichuris suis]KFD67207.1 hypothetical protein M514_07573 [Trichuris suis]KHJ46787.1 hypothetical protein D918_03143 [Trichuris suis]
MAMFKHLALLSLLLVTVYTLSVLSQPNPYQWIQPSRSIEKIIQQLKEKRKPSIGLSLAEYVADPTRADNFHFLNGRRKRSTEPGS